MTIGRSLLRRLWGVPIVLGCSALGLEAQNVFTPGAAWGANAFPFDTSYSNPRQGDGGSRDEAWAIQLDLFTEYAKDLDTLSSGRNRPYRRYNDVDVTLGFNQIGHTWRHHGEPGRSIAKSTYLRQIWVSGGFEFDTFTNWLQNDFGHGIRGYAFVPRDKGDDKAHAPILAFGTEHSLVRFLDGTLPWECCRFRATPLVSAGVGVSTLYLDEYATVGANVRMLDTASVNEIFQVGGLIRIGFVQTPLHWYRLHCGMGDRYRMTQGWVMLPPFEEWLDQGYLPRIRVTLTRSTGPFVEPRVADGGPRCDGPNPRRPKVEQLLSLRFEHDLWAFETWNDVGFKDMGPTFGLRLVRYHD
jgi:hypothetical protein